MLSSTQKLTAITAVAASVFLIGVVPALATTHFSDAATTYQTQNQPVPTPPTWNCQQNISVAQEICVGATQAGPTSISLFWNAPADVGDSPIVGYKVELAAGPNYDTWTVALANTGTADPTALVSGLTNMGLYRAKVSAINSQGTGVASAVSQWFKVFDPDTAPSSPTNVVGTPVPGGLSIAVTVPPDGTGRVPVSRTRSFVFNTDDFMVGSCDVVSTAGTTTNCTVTGSKNSQGVWVPLLANTNYYVRARTLGGQIWSPVVPYSLVQIGS